MKPSESKGKYNPRIYWLSGGFLFIERCISSQDIAKKNPEYYPLFGVIGLKPNIGLDLKSVMYS
jgi:hypothetical protein